MKIIFPAIMDKLHEMLQFINIQAKAVGFDEINVSKIELALEEALVNIIKHGYPHGNGKVEISCRQLPKRGLEVILRDQGVSYNPLKYMEKLKDPAMTLDKNGGGYGIFFILKIMDEVNYSHEGKDNILTLIKYR